MFQDDLRARAIAAGVAEFHWDEVPEKTALPYALANVISDPRPAHLKGFVGMRRTRVQVDCFGKTGKDAVLMAEALIAALSPPGTVGTTKFGHSAAEGPSDLTDDVAGKTVHRKMIQFFVAHRDIA